MDIRQLKKFLNTQPEKIKTLLEEIGCGHVHYHRGSGVDDYYTASNKFGDNQQAITVYLNESLLTINYTKEMCPDKNACDLIDLVMFNNDCSFFDALKFITDTCQIDYYQNFSEDIPESLRIIRMLKTLLNKVDSQDEDDTPIKIKDSKILSYYFPYVSEMFYEDGITYGTQREFGVGYDPLSNRWTIPIHDEIGNFVGVKGRYFDRIVPEGDKKYTHLESCPKGKILFGYNLTKDYIKNSDRIFVVESEKAVMQYWSYGIKNVIATGGTKITQNQIDKLSRLGKKIVLCFDKDFNEEKIQNLRNKFLPQVEFYAIVDKNGILKDKESPSDNKNNLEKMIKNNIYLIEKTEI